MKNKGLVCSVVMALCVFSAGVAWGFTEGAVNNFFGTGAGAANTTGAFNTFIGASAGINNTTGDANTFIGVGAGSQHVSGNNNTFIGLNAGVANTTGGNNTFIGVGAGVNTTGDRNTFIGSLAGNANNNTGSGNVFLGFEAGLSEAGSNKLYIDNCFTGPGGGCTSPLIYGEFDTRNVQIDGTLTMVSTATPSDQRYKKDIHPLESSLDKVLHLQGVSYAWKKDAVMGAGFKDGRQIGLIAQEVEKVLPELVHTDKKGYKTLSYDKLAPVLIEALKEQQKEIKEKEIHYETSLKDKDVRIERLEKALDAMEKRLTAMDNSPKNIASR